MMFSFTSFVFSALLAGCQAESLRSTSRRSLSQELIAGYEPQSQVTDHNAIDRDQFAMEMQLAKGTAAAFDVARNIYEQGGNSKSIASLRIPSGLPLNAPEGGEVTGVNAAGIAVVGKVVGGAQQGSATLLVQYLTSSVQASYSTCQVGGLEEINTAGCFLNDTGTITVAGSQATYTYDAATDNNNGRTLQGFSTGADTKMRVDTEPTNDYYQDFQKFVDYYGTFDYSDQIVTAAFENQAINLNGKVFDFSSYSDVGRAEVIKKVSAYMGVSMYALRELEDALDDCAADDSTRNDGSVKALDEGVAFYTGSLEGKDGSSDGVFLHALADKRCVNFRTCGEFADSSSGTANINLVVFQEFNRMKGRLNSGNCDAARINKAKIAEIMFVPMIQGALRYAFIQEDQVESAEKDEAEGAAFAAAVLPIVASCNENDAQIIYDNLKPGSGFNADFSAVKGAFERNYGCMRITCDDVGGLYDAGNARFYDGAHPCNSGGGIEAGLAVGISVGAVAAVAVLFFLLKGKRSSDIEFKSGDGTTNQV